MIRGRIGQRPPGPKKLVFGESPFRKLKCGCYVDENDNVIEVKVGTLGDLLKDIEEPEHGCKLTEQKGQK